MTAEGTRRKAVLAWVFVCVVWGTTYLAIRVALETIPPALIGGIRYLVAGTLLAVALRLGGERLPPRATWPGLLLLGLLMIAVGNGFVIWAQQWVPSGIAAVLVATSPFWMAGVEAVAPNGERFRARTLLGLSVGFSGILVLVWPALSVEGDWGHGFTLGVIALQLACVGWSLGTAYAKRHTQHENALASAAVQMMFGGVAMFVIATVRGEWSAVSFNPRTASATLYLIVFGSLGGYSAYQYALKHLPVSTVSLYAYVNPVIAVLLGTLLLDEPFTSREGVACILVLTGVTIVRLQGRV